LNIGAGRIVWQDIVRIDVAIKKRQFHKNEAILSSFKRAKETNGRLHLLGLVWHYPVCAMLISHCNTLLQL
jgi:2,3-bisphosphoglycerate-independent phosphoglycerate mutase